jgi:hypothetical protein
VVKIEGRQRQITPTLKAASTQRTTKGISGKTQKDESMGFQGSNIVGT